MGDNRIGMFRMMVAIARNALIVLAMILAPVYALWIGIGWMMDRRDQRRAERRRGPVVLKGNHETVRKQI